MRNCSFLLSCHPHEYKIIYNILLFSLPLVSAVMSPLILDIDNLYLLFFYWLNWLKEIAFGFTDIFCFLHSILLISVPNFCFSFLLFLIRLKLFLFSKFHRVEDHWFEALYSSDITVWCYKSFFKQGFKVASHKFQCHIFIFIQFEIVSLLRFVIFTL